MKNLKQIKFLDKNTNLNHGGILTDKGDIICACCGCFFPKSEVDNSIKIIDIYKDWIDFSDAIIEF